MHKESHIRVVLKRAKGYLITYMLKSSVEVNGFQVKNIYPHGHNQDPNPLEKRENIRRCIERARRPVFGRTMLRLLKELRLEELHRLKSYPWGVLILFPTF